VSGWLVVMRTYHLFEQKLNNHKALGFFSMLLRQSVVYITVTNKKLIIWVKIVA